MLYRNLFFRISFSLSLLFSPLFITAADGITGWILKQSVQVIATTLGFGGAIAGSRVFDQQAPYRMTHSAQLNTIKVQPTIVNTAVQGGAGTAAPKGNSLSPSDAQILQQWKQIASGYSDEEIDKSIKSSESIVNTAKSNRGYYKQGTKARKELEDHISLYEANIGHLNEEKRSRKELSDQKVRIVKQATTTAATAVVLTTKTAPTTTTQTATMTAVPGTNLWKLSEDRSKVNETTAEDKETAPEKDPKKGPNGKDIAGAAAVHKAKEEVIHRTEKPTKQRTFVDPAKATTPPHQSGVEVQYPTNPGQHDHSWSMRAGHIGKDTPKARQVVNETVKAEHYIGEDNNGNHVYYRVNPEDGKQVWIEIRANGIAKNFGANETHWPVGENGFPKCPDKAKNDNGVLYSIGAAALVGSTTQASPERTQEYREAQRAFVDDYIKKHPMPLPPTLGKMPEAPAESAPLTPKTPEVTLKEAPGSNMWHIRWTYTPSAPSSSADEEPAIWSGRSGGGKSRGRSRHKEVPGETVWHKSAKVSGNGVPGINLWSSKDSK